MDDRPRQNPAYRLAKGRAPLRRGPFYVLAALLACLLTAGGCGDGNGDAPRARAPLPAPHVELTAEDREVWAPAPADRDTIPVLLFRGVGREALARQLALLDHAGYDAIALDELVRFIKGERVALPSQPVLLTFDGGRAATWINADAILGDLGYRATLFVQTGPVDAGDAAYLRWAELDRMQRSGRWDIQLQAGTGGHLIRYGPRAGDVGAFYAYRGNEERIDGWRERVFSDISDAEELLAFRVPGHRPLAFAPPYGNYGQAGTNDARIPRLLFKRLRLDYAAVFVQDRSPLAKRGAGTAEPFGRLEITPGRREEDVRRALGG